MAQFSLRRSVVSCQRYLALCSKGPEKCSEDAALLRVPAKHRIEVDGFAMQVIELRIDLLERELPERRGTALPALLSPKPSSSRARKTRSNLPSGRALEIEVELGKDAQAAKTRVGIEKLRQRERAGRAKRRRRDRAARRDARRGIFAHVRDVGFAGAVPVFQRGFEIALEKIDCAEKIVGVGVAGLEAEGLAQPANACADSFFA